MNPDQAKQLADLLRKRRETLHLSASEVARRAGVTTGTVTRIELCQIVSPLPESLTAIADVLGIPRSDIFALMGWVSPGQLPSLRPYLRSTYRDLSERAVAEVEHFITDLQRKHAGPGPQPGEDEH